MKRSTGLTALAAAALPLLSLSLSACGSADNSSSDSGSAADSSADASAATGGSNQLTVWCWDPTFNIYAMQEAEKIYQQDHPDFSLNIVETAWDDLQTKLTTLGQSGQIDQLPDIILVQNNAFQKNVQSYPDLFTDMTNSGVDFSEYPEGITAYSTVDGKNYGLPFDNGAAIDALRIDLLQQAGLTLDDFTDITWDKYIELGQQVYSATNLPLLTGQAGSPDIIMMMMQSAGASLFDDQGNPTITDNAALLKSIDYYKQMVDDHVLVEVNSWDEYIATFQNNNAAGTINGSWIIGSITATADQSGKWDITDVPKLDGIAGATNYSANGGSSWAVTANANQDLAFDFLKSTFAGSTELYDTILPSSGALANWMPAGQSSVYAEPQAYFNNDAIYAKIVDYTSKVPSNNTGVFYYEARDAVGKALTEIIGGTDPATALQEAQDTVEFDMESQ